MEAGVVVMQSVGKVNTVVNLRNQHMVIVVFCMAQENGACVHKVSISNLQSLVITYIYIKETATE